MPLKQQMPVSTVWFAVTLVASVVVNTPVFTCKEMCDFGNVLFLRQMCTGCYTSF